MPTQRTSKGFLSNPQGIVHSPYGRQYRSDHKGFLCGMAPLVLAPHTIICMGVESFAEENRCPLYVGTYISL
jgi:hypothetical protein